MSDLKDIKRLMEIAHEVLVQNGIPTMFIKMVERDLYERWIAELEAHSG